MSIADIFFSMGLALSPFVGPKDNPDALFAIGTTGLCEAIGFIHIIGLLCLVFYTVFLTYYFLKRIRYKRTPSDFAKKEEKYFHALFIMFSLAVSVAGLVTGSINPLSHGSICQIVSYPPNCERSSDIICERGLNAKRIMRVGSIFLGTSFVALFISLSLCVHHVYMVERQFTRPARGIGRIRRNTSNLNNQANREPGEENRDENNQEQRIGENKLVLTKQAFGQSLLYILAFLLVYSAPIIKLIQEQFFGNEEEPEWRFWLGALFTPLGGVFNIIIYTRPKVMKVMETLSSTSYLRCFIVVVVSGGEVPSFADLISSSPMNSHSNHVHESGQVEGFNEDDALSMSSGVSSMDISKASSLMVKFGWGSQICNSSISKPEDTEESLKVDS